MMNFSTNAMNSIWPVRKVTSLYKITTSFAHLRQLKGLGRCDKDLVNALIACLVKCFVAF